ncbi:MAG: hypothetical protein CL512_05730 [Actinobacteria bacterium]|nr:hypothetical protein [Actinomycetota bacterium]|tara:strand:+ start:3371 stop:3595 length:225 start_codon:yes stop_codon:yes gene_type:complete
MIEKNWKPQPSDKAEQVDHAITAIFGFDRKENIKAKQCVFCGTQVELDSFKDEVSLKEFHISGMCQPCQDKVFG